MRNLTSDIFAGALGLLVLGLATPALAQSERSKSEDTPAALAPEEDERTLPPGAEDLPPPSAGELLAERERSLDARAAELEQMKKDLAVAETKLMEKIERLEGLIAKKEKVEKKILSEKEKERRRRLARMIEVTSKMPPEGAAAYLIEMPLAIASDILSGIKSRKAAAIMAALPPSKAAEIGRKYLKSGKSNLQDSIPPPSASRGDGAGAPSSP